MISVLAQERLLGATLGSVVVGGIVLNQRRGIYSTISHNQTLVHITPHNQPKKFPFENFSSNLVNIWNKAVDGTLGNLVAYLSSRRW